MRAETQKHQRPRRRGGDRWVEGRLGEEGHENMRENMRWRQTTNDGLLRQKMNMSSISADPHPCATGSKGRITI